MNFFPLKEVAELTVNRFAESPLGKMTEGKKFDNPMSEYDKPLGEVVEKFRNCPIEGNNGHWDGERGNSIWFPDPDFVPGKANPEGKTWSEILDKYEISCIPFKDGEPDFSKVCKGEVEIESFSDNRPDNFDKADIELAKQKGCTPEEVAAWRKENGYTWHECRDMKTMQKVPSEIHNNIPHSGGISEAKKGIGDNA
ncbi:HNH endonuclease [Cytobacillus sp. FJAT-53684]|uniref:HNH endonuclease n=1 Tax=Cytobacillus mangrovibacter TaxID=3299024 RepID=A0ABW6K0Q4_9BACI